MSRRGTAGRVAIHGHSGYRIVYDGHGNYKYEHRLVMEQKLGRKLRSEETVHHVNGVRTDNRPENLMVFTSRADHLRHHMAKPPAIRLGPTFDPTYLRDITNASKRWRNGVPVTALPGFAESLKSLLQQGYQYTDIAAMFGVCVQRICQLVQRYGLRSHYAGRRAWRIWNDSAGRFEPLSAPHGYQREREINRHLGRAMNHRGGTLAG